MNSCFMNQREQETATAWIQLIVVDTTEGNLIENTNSSIIAE